jgi:adenine-specific DNA-methyltransferase
MSKYDDLVLKLKEILQIDRPELDFGVYRILNARAGEINDYLDNRLKLRVQEALATAGNANSDQLRKELSEAEKNAQSLGMNADDVLKVRELRQRLAELVSGAADHENAVFSHLLTFFSRYYDTGDFISQRRYKGDTYAIPYSGEEVVLHWANKDQYYTKSGEYFANYSFKLTDGRSVHFRLVAADTAKDNRKDNDKERRFVLIERQTRVVTDDEGDEYEEELLPVEEINGELVLRFEYKPMPKGTKQDELVNRAVQSILADETVKNRWLELAKREPTEKNPQRTMLEMCLAKYVSKNSADYFIHKDLGGFLRRELDFYIKNEVMNLDDVQNAERFADIEKNLRMIQCLRAIAQDLITFLAQLQDFQKKLWLKKKFVVAAHYCITLDRIIKDAPELLATIAANEKQWAQWEALGMLEKQIPPSPPLKSGEPEMRNLFDKSEVEKSPLIKGDLGGFASRGTEDYLREHPFLMADTALYDSLFKDKLLAAIDDLDESVDGLLIHGDNFQALNLLQERYREQVKCVYIDPPYNTNSTLILYKNEYKDSSWASLMQDRLLLSMSLLKEDGVKTVAIDDSEMTNLSIILEDIAPSYRLSRVAVVHNPKGSITKDFNRVHEYSLFLTKADKKGYIARTLEENDTPRKMD